MKKRLLLLTVVTWVSIHFLSLGGEKPFSWTYGPAQGENIGVRLSAYSLGKYLEECQVNRPEITVEVQTLLAEGKHYRKRTRDQKSKPTLLTVYVDKDHTLHIVTHRDETCPTCNGTGKRGAPFGKMTSQVAVNFRCLDCDGKGVLENHTNERFFMLSSEDFENPEQGRQLFAEKAYAGAPAGAEVWVERLASKDPRERLEACIWLDSHYVQVGSFFQDIMPMLKKARYYDSNEKRKIMVWQFWAGKDLQGETKRTYYRIYADTKSGKVTKKGFFSGS